MCGGTKSIPSGGSFLDIFLDIQECPFCPLRAAIFKTRNATRPKHGCEHYALISHFRRQKHVTDFFGGSWQNRPFGYLGDYFM